MERIKKGAELAAWRHGFQARELTIAVYARTLQDQFSRRLGTKAIKRRATSSARLRPQS